MQSLCVLYFVLLSVNKIRVVNVASDPAIADSELARKLANNREVSLISLEKIISKYANQQDDVAEEERRKRLEKEKQKKEMKRVKRGEVWGRGSYER